MVFQFLLELGEVREHWDRFLLSTGLGIA
jgi:hypothetical protein